MTCPRLTGPDNGLVIVRGLSVGSTATYRCVPGFVLRGSRRRVCQSSGEWSGRDPTCEMVDCPDLPDPDNGEVTLSGNTFLSTANYRLLLQYFKNSTRAAGSLLKNELPLDTHNALFLTHVYFLTC